MVGAAAALAMSLACAHPWDGHGGGGGRGGWHGAGAHGMSAAAGRAEGVGPRWGLRPNPSRYQAAYPSAYNPSAYRGAPGGFPGQYPGGYAGSTPYRAVSAESRHGGRMPGPDATMRTGSIREDVARYNEERGGRPMPSSRPRDDGARRASFFSSFYRGN